MPAMHIHE